MAIEYRPAKPDEMRAFALAGQLGFGQSTAEAAVEQQRTAWPVQSEWTLCAFDDGVIASKMAAFPFSMRWNGRDIACGGVTSVTTSPDQRRRGHLRQLMTRAFAQMRDTGVPVAMLWASMAAIYQRFGYGIAYGQGRCDFDPRLLRFIDTVETPGRVRLLPHGDEIATIAGPYAHFAMPRTLMLRREDHQWRPFVTGTWPPEAPPALVAVYDEGNESLGYAVYTIEEIRSDAPGPDQRLNVRELIWQTPAAHRALIQFLAGYDLAFSVRLSTLPADDPLFHQVEEPRLLNIRHLDGTLLRIVDLAPALEGRGYDADGRLTFALEDELCPWNSGAWRLTVEGGKASLRPAEGEAALRFNPRALAILASGHLSASTLARIGLIDVADAAALPVADGLFRTAYAPLCLDRF